MSRRRVMIFQTGTANIASVCAGIARAGGEPIVAGSCDEIEAAEFVVLPGVGSFGAAIATLQSAGALSAIRRRVERGSSTLAICVGLQVLFDRSEESPGVAGLGIVQGDVCRFRDVPRLPQMGWNYVDANTRCAVLQSGYAYFANSYRVEDVHDAAGVAVANYGGSFVAGFERGGLIACQFHPELSGAWGIDLLRRWIGTKRAVATCS